MLKSKIKSTVSMLVVCSLLGACSSVPEHVDDLPEGVNIAFMGDTRGDYEVSNLWTGVLSGTQTVSFKLTNTTSEELGVLYSADWTTASGRPTETNNSQAVKMVPAASSVSIVIPSSNKDSVNADIAINEKNLNRDSLMLNENDYKEMITAVISDFRQQLDLGGRKLTVALDRFENNTDDSTVRVENMAVFVQKSLQKTGSIRVVKSSNNPDIDVHLTLEMQGGITSSAANKAAYTLVLSAHNNLDEEITSSATLNFHK